MLEMDGHYRYAGSEVRWGPAGVEFHHPRFGGRSVHVPWRHVTGARDRGTSPSFVQVEVRGRRPAEDHEADLCAVPVRSDEDARRLLTQFSWYAGRGYPPATRPHRPDRRGVLADPLARARARLRRDVRPS